MMKALQRNAKVRTLVFWDIKTCPVPSACDASRVAPCIRRFLKNSGYSGPVTIVAVGLLTDVPSDVLRAVSSTGIVLNHVSFGSVGILSTIYDWINYNNPPINIMFISSNPSLHIPAHKGLLRYNIFRLFPYKSPNPESLWKDFLLEDSASLKEDQCSETGGPARWLCSVCFKVTGQGFENFTAHLSTLKHAQEASYMDEKAKSVMVFWDIKRFPVPPGYDPRLVGPCIKRFLKNKGYSGRITIVVIGLLSDAPVGVLRALSSTTGIVLRNVLLGSNDFVEFVYLWTYRISSPAHLMLIGPCPQDIISSLQRLGYNIIRLFRRNAVSLWKKFLLKDSKTLEEDKSGGPVPWVCSACRDDVCGQGFENFTMHLDSKEHVLEMSEQLPSNEKDEAAVEAGDQAPPELRAPRRMTRRVTCMRMKKPRMAATSTSSGGSNEWEQGDFSSSGRKQVGRANQSSPVLVTEFLQLPYTLRLKASILNQQPCSRGRESKQIKNQVLRKPETMDIQRTRKVINTAATEGTSA